MSNDPYSTPARYQEADLKRWSDANERARREYRLNPIAACGVTDCERLRAHGRMCSVHAGPNYRGQR